MNPFKKYPKIELHRHLEGAVRLSTLNEISKGLSTLTDSQKNFQILTPYQNLSEVLKGFENIQRCLNSEEILERISFECLEDAAEENNTYLEIRFSPTFIAQKNPHLTFNQILNAIWKGLKKGSHLPVQWGLICIFQRTLSDQENKKVLSFFLDHLDHFVGADLADDEVVGQTKNFQWIFSEVQKHNKGITIHAGEAAGKNFSLQSAQNVLTAIQDLGAIRIGHGVQIMHHPEMIKFVKSKNICLELCPTSNWITQAVSDLKSHPLKTFLDQGLNVTINSDDPGVFGIDLSHEYKVCSDILGFTNDDFKKVYQNSLQSLFIGKFSSGL